MGILEWPFRTLIKVWGNPRAGRLFFDAFFSMLAKMAMVDGPFSEKELQVFTEIMDREFSLSRKEKQKAISILLKAGASDKNFQTYAIEFQKAFRSSPATLENTMDLLFAMAYSDNRLSIGEVLRTSCLYPTFAA